MPARVSSSASRRSPISSAASDCTATTLRSRCWPRARPTPGGSGSMSVTIAPSPAARSPPRSTASRATVAGNTPWLISQAGAASSRPTPMPASASSTPPIASQGRSPGRCAGPMHAASSSNSPMSPPRHDRQAGAADLADHAGGGHAHRRDIRRRAGDQRAPRRSAPFRAAGQDRAAGRRSRCVDSPRARGALASCTSRQGVDYMLRRWDGFAGFLAYGKTCLTNTAAERTLRGVALGRKAWLFAGSDRGGDRAA